VKNLKLALKVLISLGLLAYLLSTVDSAVLVRLILQARFLPLLSALLLMLAGVVLSARKWQALLRVDNVDVGITELTRYYLVGIYFNNFLPTSIGGDAVRGFLVSRSQRQRMAVLTSILAERFSGVLALLVIALVGIRYSPLLQATEWAGWISIVLLLGLIGLVLVLSARFTGFLLGFLPNRLADYFQHALSKIRAYTRSYRTIWTVVWVSLAFQGLTILVYDLGAQAFGMEVTLLNLMAMVPLVTLATLLPLSLNGIGIREGGFMILFDALGYSAESGLLLSISIYVLTLILSLAGAVIFLGTRKHSRLNQVGSRG